MHGQWGFQPSLRVKKKFQGQLGNGQKETRTLIGVEEAKTSGGRGTDNDDTW